MNVSKMAMLVNTDKLDQVRAFYIEHLGFRVTFDGAGYLGLTSEGEGAEIGFMVPNPEQHSMPYGGDGVTLCLEVKSPDAEHDRLVSKGIEIGMPLDDYPWGDRAFTIVDPTGVHVYLYCQGKPSDEFASFIKT